jgi:hypothetical protein
LGELRDEGRAVLQGTRRWARWLPVGAKAQQTASPIADGPNRT